MPPIKGNLSSINAGFNRTFNRAQLTVSNVTVYDKKPRLKALFGFAKKIHLDNQEDVYVDRKSFNAAYAPRLKMLEKGDVLADNVSLIKKLFSKKVKKIQSLNDSNEVVSVYVKRDEYKNLIRNPLRIFNDEEVDEISSQLMSVIEENKQSNQQTSVVVPSSKLLATATKKDFLLTDFDEKRVCAVFLQRLKDNGLIVSYEENGNDLYTIGIKAPDSPEPQVQPGGGVDGFVDVEL